MKYLILALGLLVSSQSFAVAQAEYQCGPYTYFIFGNVYSSLRDAAGNEVGHWEGEDEGPTFFVKHQLHLKWNGRTYRCAHLGTTP